MAPPSPCTTPRPDLSADPIVALTAVVSVLREEVSALRQRIDNASPAARYPPRQKKPAGPTPTPAAKQGPKAKGKRAKPPQCQASTIAATTLSLPLAQDNSTEDRALYQVTVVIPDAVVGHVVGRQGRSLKQVADISGARISAFVVKDGPSDQRHVSIRGTDSQIGEGLVVLGKRLARKRVQMPRSSIKKDKKNVKPAPASSTPATHGSSTTMPSTSRYPLPPVLAEEQSTVERPLERQQSPLITPTQLSPRERSPAPSPTVVMAPSVKPTPSVSSGISSFLSVGPPSSISSGSTAPPSFRGDAFDMEIDRVRTTAAPGQRRPPPGDRATAADNYTAARMARESRGRRR
jgi:hypothetical protein